MTHRIHAHWDEIEALVLKNSTYCVVHYLLGLIVPGALSPVAVILPPRKILIAARLAVPPETVSRTLRSLSEAGLSGDDVTLIDIERLRQHLQ
ncbi:MAG: helix-turn-helix domain-containing protein [Pseudomonadota bacterium]|nr:helix-turn-helix domain-containing protein [Pseudomonadota bacterium]